MNPLDPGSPRKGFIGPKQLVPVPLTSDIGVAQVSLFGSKLRGLGWLNSRSCRFVRMRTPSMSDLGFDEFSIWPLSWGARNWMTRHMVAYPLQIQMTHEVPPCYVRRCVGSGLAFVFCKALRNCTASWLYSPGWSLHCLCESGPLAEGGKLVPWRQSMVLCAAWRRGHAR